MNLFDVLAIHKPGLSPKDCKVHLATPDGRYVPLDEYFSGGFNEWQRRQGLKVFERACVVSLIHLGDSRWLFAGVHHQKGRWSVTDPENYDGAKYRYDLDEDDACADLNGRLIINFKRTERAAFRDAETCADRLIVHELRPEKLSVQAFPGFKAVLLSRSQLETIFREKHESWQAALSSVAGVYVITDTQTGQLYVGSATGEGGLWKRWGDYAATGHGGNKELRKLLGRDARRATSFQYAVLEIADTHASPEDVLQREAHWKRVLLSRAHGLNNN